MNLAAILFQGSRKAGPSEKENPPLRGCAQDDQDKKVKGKSKAYSEVLARLAAGLLA